MLLLLLLLVGDGGEDVTSCPGMVVAMEFGNVVAAEEEVVPEETLE